MDNISYRIEGGNLSQKEINKIITSFETRIKDILNDDVTAIIVINPVMQNYANRNYESICGNTPRYLVDDGKIVTAEIRIRLASFMPQSSSIALLFIIEQKTTNTTRPQIHHGSFIPNYLVNESILLSNIIKNQDRNQEKRNNIFCVSGEIGIGKTYFVHYLANKLNRVIHTINYSDIDGENTSVIADNIKKFWSQVNQNDFVLLEDSDSYLTGHNINRFVKSALLSSFNKHRGCYIFIETCNPGKYENDIRKHIFRYICLSPLNDKLRIEYLQNFLKEFSTSTIQQVKSGLSLVGFSVIDLQHLAYIASVNLSLGVPELECIIRACEEVNNSKLHSSLSSDAPFKAIRPKYKLDDLILPVEKKDRIKYAISLIDNIPLVYNEWNFSTIDPYPRAILNFHGDPGTGKTMCAHAIASHLGKDLLALNYAEIESKYIGDAPKKLESAFAFARQHNVIMFFDEADSFLGKRVENVRHSADQALNSLRSTMLIQLEMYEGVVIFATNLRENYDKAFKSRFLYEIQFELPNEECREQILETYISKLEPLKNANYSPEQLKTLIKETEGLSGRDIKSLILDSLNILAYKCGNGEISKTESQTRTLPYDILLDCIENRKKNKDTYSVNTDVDEDKRIIGEQLKNNIEMEQRKKIHKILISLGYYAAWADGELQQEELDFIKSSEIDLDIELPDYTNRDNLPEWEYLVSQIVDNSLFSQAIELCSQIISAKGIISEKEMEFMCKLCTDINIRPEIIDGVIECLKLNAERMHKWNTLVQKI